MAREPAVGITKEGSQLGVIRRVSSRRDRGTWPRVMKILVVS